MNFNLVEMYNGLLRFNKHILNELAEGLKHLPNLDGVSKGDSLIINEQGNPAWASAAFIPTFENAAYGIEWTKGDNDIIRIGNAKFHRELPIQNRLKGCVYNEKKISYFLNPNGWAKPLENGLIPPFDFRFGPYFVPNKVGTNKKADYNWKRNNDGQDTDKAVCALMLGGGANNVSGAGSGDFHSFWTPTQFRADTGFFTTVKID